MTYKKQEGRSKKKERSLGKSSKKSLESEECKYEIIFKPSANKEFESLDSHIQTRIIEKIEKLKYNPYLSGVKKLSASDNIFRLRIGKYRVLYTLIKQRIVILILKVGLRRDIYKVK